MYIDIFISIILLWAIINGWRNGFFQELISGIGLFVGLFVAATCYETLSEYLTVEGSEANMVTSIAAFFILWIIVPIALGFVALLLTKAVKFMQLGILNSILGSLVGVVKFIVLISCLLNMMVSLHILNDERTQDSALFKPVFGLLEEPFNNAVYRLTESQTSTSDTLWVDFSQKELPTDSL
jgi:uncharacterized membrane protein required for colicin V production